MSSLSTTLEMTRTLLAAGQNDKAVETLETLASNVRNSDAWFLLGATYHRLGRIEDALVAFRHATVLSHDGIQPELATAAVLSDLGRDQDAAVEMRRLLELNPNDPTLWTNFGIVQERLDCPADALSAYDRALTLNPAHRNALLNRGYVLSRLGRLEAALKNNRFLSAEYPDDADAHFNTAEVLNALERWHEAIDACSRAIALQPAHVKAHVDRALARAVLGDLEAAQSDLDRARALDPGALETFSAADPSKAGVSLAELDARSIYLHMLAHAQDSCDWSRRSEFIAAFERRVTEAIGTGREVTDTGLPFRAFGIPVRRETITALARSVARAMSAKAAKKPLAAPKPLRADRSRIRLAYVSPDFRSHPGGYLTRHLYRLHDRSRFEVYGYALHPDDGSDVRREIQRGCDALVDVSGFAAREVAERIRRDGIHIAIDLSGYTTFTKPEAFAYRSAPVQINYLGFPGTLGAGYLDYAIVDAVVCPPGSDGWWDEKLVRLPHCYYVTDGRPQVDASSMSREILGLPRDAIVFCCFNNSWKIEPGIFEIWMRILSRAQNAVLWLVAANPAVIINLRREAALRGVSPDRLVFAPRLPHDQHLARYRFADLFLDTPVCNAHTTGVDALGQGVPVLTLPGESMHSRVGASLVIAAGVPEMICRTAQEYEERAVALSADTAELGLLKQKLSPGQKRAPLFDTEASVRALEAAYQEMWRRFEKGLPPVSFDVADSRQNDWNSPWH